MRFAKNVWGLDGSDETALAIAGIAALENFFREAKIPMTLSELGIGAEHFAEMAAHANRDGYLKNAFVPLTTDDIVEIFRLCL